MVAGKGPASAGIASDVWSGKIRVLGELGGGAMANVLRGYDTKLRREVALKVTRLKRREIPRQELARFGLSAGLSFGAGAGALAAGAVALVASTARAADLVGDALARDRTHIGAHVERTNVRMSRRTGTGEPLSRR